MSRLRHPSRTEIVRLFYKNINDPDMSVTERRFAWNDYLAKLKEDGFITNYHIKTWNPPYRKHSDF